MKKALHCCKAFFWLPGLGKYEYWVMAVAL
jgi:hypothetical protein